MLLPSLGMGEGALVIKYNWNGASRDAQGEHENAWLVASFTTYMFGSPNYMVKKLNEAGKYDWFVCEMSDQGYVYIELELGMVDLLRAA